MSRRNLLGRLLEYLNGPEPAENRPRPTRAIERPEAEMSSPEEFGDKAGRIFAEQHPVVGGRIQVLNLQPLHARYKERWSRLAEIVHRHVVNILKHRLSPQDAFTKNADDSYVIVFADMSEEEATLKCALLAREIMEKLQGTDDGATEADVQAVVATLSGNVGLEASETLEQINQALDARMPPSAKSADAPTAYTRDPLAQLFAAIERELQVLDAGAIARDPAAVQANMHRICEMLYRAEAELALIANDPIVPAGSAPDWISVSRDRARTMLGAVDQIRAAIEQHTGSPAIPASGDTAELEIVYRPVWQARRGVVTTYRCDLRIKTGLSQILHDDPMPDEDGVAISHAMDRLVLRRAVRDLAAGVEEQRPTVVIIPVHYLTVTRQVLSSSYLRTIHTIPEKLRSLIVWEVLDAPAGTWSGQIFPVLSVLKRFGRAVILRVPESTLALRELAAIGGHAAGFDLRTCDGSERVLIQKIERFAASAERAGMQCFLYGVASLSVMDAAVAAGFDYIAGDTIAKTVNHPAGVVPTELYHVYERNLRKDAR